MGERKRTLSNVLFTTVLSQLLSSTSVAVSDSIAANSGHWPWLECLSLQKGTVRACKKNQPADRVTYLYGLADAAYCNGVIRAVFRQEGHVPLIDHNARRGEKIEFAPHEAERYQARSQAERVKSLLKDNLDGRHVRMRGAPKVYTHWMFGTLVIAAEQILRLSISPHAFRRRGRRHPAASPYG